MPYFDFTDGPSTGIQQTVTQPASLQFVDGDVTFTFSATQVDGNAGIAFYNSSSTFQGTLFAAPISGAGDVFQLSAADGSKTWFTGTASSPISLALLATSFGPFWEVRFIGAHGTGTQTRQISGSSFITGITGEFSAITFTASMPGTVLIIPAMIANINCFLTGTRIATPGGEVAIEHLKAGDSVLRADGSVTTVRWLGEQVISTRFQHPAKVNPIRISAGALGEGLPQRDLFVTADHALFLGGLLVNAGALVNGSTIAQVKTMPREGFSYWHVETEAHEVILAEGCPVETYIDYVGRDGFSTVTGVASDARITEMPLPRVSAARHLPPELARRVGRLPAVA